jgi:hypothetical protein
VAEVAEVGVAEVGVGEVGVAEVGGGEEEAGRAAMAARAGWAATAGCRHRLPDCKRTASPTPRGR